MLVRDVLVMRGHREIRIMDGPGDGCRDIHSRTEQGRLHIAQVAHVNDPRKTIGTRKMGELPNALLKFGVSVGMFVTSGRISPQAKREYKNDYPRFELDFLDGDALADEVLRQMPLKAIWFDGVDFGRVSNSIRIPLLLRDLESDRPLELPEKACKADWRFPVSSMQVECRQEWISATELAPYRQPESPALFEGTGATFRAHVLTLSGKVPLDVLFAACREIGRTALARIPKKQLSRLVAARVGRPSIVPLKGEWAGSSINVGPRGITLLRDSNGAITDEWEWLAEVDETWCRATDLRASTADWLRRYHPQLDLCFSVELITTLTEAAMLETSSQVRLIKRDWARSVFCLAGDGYEENLKTLTLQPTGCFPWADGRAFLVWSFRAFAGPFASIADDGEGFLPIKQREQDVERELADVRSWAKTNGHELVDETTARHMMALVDEDPYPGDRSHYRFVDIETGRPIPSPIDPRGRFVFLDVCFLVSDAPSKDLSSGIDDVFAAWSRENNISEDAFMYERDVKERDGVRQTFIHLRVIQVNADPLASTRARLDAFVVEFLPMLERLEQAFAAAGIRMRRATRQYWQELCLTDFRVPTA